jgi:hypothetical protein
LALRSAIETIGAIGISFDQEVSMVAFKKTSIMLLASTFVLALAIDAADARARGAGARAGGAGRAHVSRPIAGTGRIAGNRVGWAGNRPGYGYGYGRGYGWGAAAVAGAALGTAGYYGAAYGAGSDPYAYASGGYYQGDDAYAAGADYGGGDTYILHGATMSEPEAVQYCAQTFRSYDIGSRTFLSYSGQRVPCPQ